MSGVRGPDEALVAAQLGRPPTTRFEIVARCPDGHPLVIRNHPVDVEGNPFPTRYWLTCPDAVKAVSRLESGGAIGELNDRAHRDRPFGRELEDAHRAYAIDRGRVVAGAEAWGGVGGTKEGLKCLHAHYAYRLAGGDDPAGAFVAEQIEPVHPEMAHSRRVAAVDLGTNSIRLLVADLREGDLSEVARDMVITRIGQAVDRSGRLAPEAVRRTMETLALYVRRAQALGATQIKVSATSAVRDVEEEDREDLVREIEALTGSHPEVLTGAREAELSFLGATADTERPGPFLVFDIGGGSTEFAFGQEQPEATGSVDVGSVRITERVQPADPPTSREQAEMATLAGDELGLVEELIPVAAATVIGVGGTTTTIQALALGLGRYDPEVIHGSVLSRVDAERVAGELVGMTIAERAALPVMAPGREDVIVAGALILIAILERFGDACVVSERDILDGLALEMVRGEA